MLAGEFKKDRTHQKADPEETGTAPPGTLHTPRRIHKGLRGLTCPAQTCKARGRSEENHNTCSDVEAEVFEEKKTQLESSDSCSLKSSMRIMTVLQPRNFALVCSVFLPLTMNSIKLLCRTDTTNRSQADSSCKTHPKTERANPSTLMPVKEDHTTTQEHMYAKQKRITFFRRKTDSKSVNLALQTLKSVVNFGFCLNREASKSDPQDVGVYASCSCAV